MSEDSKVVDYLRRVTAELRTTRARLRELEAEKDGPIAIVGIGCRYPGDVRSPDDLWELLAAERDAISPFPADRGWDLDGLAASGGCGTGSGGFLDGATDFDAGFFGIAPREALAMDPQQRLALEVTWEALEHAGIDPRTLRGSDTAVFVGANQQEYGPSLHESPPEVAGHRLTGAANSVISGRVSYVLGLNGPAMTVDTACSSSLVAIDLACQALRQNDTGLAVAGGVTVMATPGTLTGFDRQGGLSADGRCKSFSADADGTGLAEGAGFVVLERLSDARRDGHRVWGVVRGGAVNQDGASNGLSAPSGPAQQRVIERALAKSGLDAVDIDAVEAHGTGTALGDPIEASAILAAYGSERPGERPLWLGSLKSNLGHTQAAAGVGGVIKMLLALEHELLPRSLHSDDPTPHVDWSPGTVRLLAKARPWPTVPGRPRRAGISSFGISGTNAHLIIEEPPVAAREDSAPPEPARPVWLVSGRSPEALRAQASRLRAHVRARPELSIPDVAHSLGTIRTGWEHRAGLLGRNREELLDQLDALADGRPHPGLLRGAPRGGATAYLFSGQGTQHAGMGSQAYAAFPAFAAALDEVCSHVDPLLGRSLRELMFTAPQATLDRTEFTQPALFALQVAQFRLLESWGLRPDVLAGHSVGELAVAHVSGILSLPDAATLAVTRGRLMQSLAPGVMVAAAVSEEEVRPLLDGLSDRISVAAVNGPRSVVLSGHEDVIAGVTAQLRKSRRLRGEHAFHSPLLEPILAELRAVAETLTFHPARIPVVSTMTGMTGGLDSAQYWAAQARRTVLFAKAIDTIVGERRATGLVELGPDNTLLSLAERTTERELAVVPISRPGRTETDTLVEAAVYLHVSGRSPQWSEILPGRRVPIPTYAFQRERYWLGDLTREFVLAESLSPDDRPWLADHVLGTAPVLPATAFLQLALRAGQRVGRPHLTELVLQAPLDMSDKHEIRVRVSAGHGDRPLRIDARPAGSGEWTSHAIGTLSATTSSSAPRPWSSAGAEPVAIDSHYARADARGLHYGPQFQGLTAVWRNGNDLLTETAGTEPEALFHPAALDSALQALLLDADGPPALPFTFTGVQAYRSATGPLRARITRLDTTSVAVDVFDDSGPVLSIDSLLLREIRSPAHEGELSRLDWVPTSIPPHSPEDYAVLGEPHPALATTADGSTAKSVVVHFSAPPNDIPDLPRAIHAATAEQLAVLREALAESGPHLTLLTHNATGDNPNLAAATVRGLWRSAAAEHPHRITLLDLDDSPASDAVLAATIGTRLPDLRLERGTTQIPVLRPVSAVSSPGRLDPTGTVLITGGTGALGARLARHLVSQHGIHHLILTSRRGLAAPGAEALAAELGATITAHDVTDTGQVADLLASVPPQHPLTAVVHAAGTVRDAVVTSLTPEQLDDVLKPKLDAAWQLHQQTRHLDLPVFLLYSSLAGVIGTAGQANYAAANAFLDALAHHRAHLGQSARSVAWGWWDDSGMTRQLSAADRRRLDDLGLTPMSDTEGLALFDAALGASEPMVVAARLDTERAFPGLTTTAVTENDDVLTVVRHHTAVTLGYAGPESVPDDAEFAALGLDSLMSVELRNALSDATGLRLTLRVMLQHPTPRTLADYLRSELDRTEDS